MSDHATTDTREIIVEILLSLEKGQDFSHKLMKAVLDKYDYLDRNEGSGVSGTKLIVSSVREFWSKDDISRFYKEANKIVSPYTLLNPPFKIYIKII